MIEVDAAFGGLKDKKRHTRNTVLYDFMRTVAMSNAIGRAFNSNITYIIKGSIDRTHGETFAWMKVEKGCISLGDSLQGLVVVQQVVRDIGTETGSLFGRPREIGILVRRNIAKVLFGRFGIKQEIVVIFSQVGSHSSAG